MKLAKTCMGLSAQIVIVSALLGLAASPALALQSTKLPDQACSVKTTEYKDDGSRVPTVKNRTCTGLYIVKGGPNRGLWVFVGDVDEQKGIPPEPDKKNCWADFDKTTEVCLLGH